MYKIQFVNKRTRLINDMAEYYVNISKRDMDKFEGLVATFKVNAMTQSFINNRISENRELMVIEKFQKELVDNYNAGGGTALRMLGEVKEAVKSFVAC